MSIQLPFYRHSLDASHAERVARVLGFEPGIRVEEGVREIHEALTRGVTDDGPRMSTVKWYRSILEAKRLLDTIQLDGRIL